MENVTMYLRRTSPPTPDNCNPTSVILECLPEVLQQFIDACAKPKSRASEDAALMSLGNGSELTGGGFTWQRVQKPLNFVPAPTRCDISGTNLGNVMYDAKTKQGPWATMSQNSWEFYGCGKLGTGFGQKYLRNQEGEFYLSEGMVSMPKAWRSAA